MNRPILCVFTFSTQCSNFFNSPGHGASELLLEKSQEAVLSSLQEFKASAVLDIDIFIDIHCNVGCKEFVDLKIGVNYEAYLYFNYSAFNSNYE